MIDETSELPIPSTLRESGDRIDSVKQRVMAVRDAAFKLGYKAPEKFATDEHYWYLTMNSYSETSGMLRKVIPNKDIRQAKAMEIAMIQASNIAEIEERASIDGLTGARSRKALDNFTENLRSRGIRAGVIMIDADHFKLYNDNNGHGKGDEALQLLVHAAKENVRPTDMVARYGGEEFMLIIPGLEDTNRISETADEIRRTIEKTSPITVSLGVTVTRPEDASLKAIYKRADTNLYKAKHEGRNVVINDNGRFVPQVATPVK